MGRIIQAQTNFIAGEIDPLLRSRIDLQQYYAAVQRARNVTIQPQGGITRRPGGRYLFSLPASAANGVQMIEFEFSTSQTYVMVLVDKRLYIINNGALVTNINGTGNDYLDLSRQSLLTLTSVTGTYQVGETVSDGTRTGTVIQAVSGTELLIADPSGTFSGTVTGGTSGATGTFSAQAVRTQDAVAAASIGDVYWTQSADTLLLFEEDMAPKTIVRQGANNLWRVTDTEFENLPQHAFVETRTTPAATLTPSATDGNITLTAGASVFLASHVNQYIEALNGFGRARIIEYTSGTVVKASVDIPFFNTSAIASGDWELITGYEDVWSTTRGWPRSATFHQGRLIIGGSKSRPSTIWGSRVGQVFNFEQGQALDDEGIEATIDTSTVNAITGVISGRDLQIFTTGGEFAVPQADLEPLTPSNFFVQANTFYGSRVAIKPVGSEAGVLFIQRQGKAVREFNYQDVAAQYVAENVSLLSSHLLRGPTDMKIRRATSTTEGDLLLIVNGDDGTCAVWTLLKREKVVAASLWSTDGEFKTIGTDIDRIFTVVKRTINSADAYMVEELESDYTTDAALQYNVGWYGTTLVDGAAQSGTTLVVDGLTTRPAENDRFTIDGVTGTYTVVSATALSSTESTLVITPALASTPADDAPVTWVACSRVTGLGHLEGEVVKCIADDVLLADRTVAAGEIILSRPATDYAEIGLDYAMTVQTMPVETRLPSGNILGSKKRIVEVTLIVSETQNLTVNGREVSFRRFNDFQLGGGQTSFTGTKYTGPILGFSLDASITLSQTAPLFATVLGLEYKVSVGQ